MTARNISKINLRLRRALNHRTIPFRFLLPGPWADYKLVPDDELGEDEWQKAAREREPVSCVGKVRYAPPIVRWTLTEPVVPGLYAIRVKGGRRRMVDVYADDRGRVMASSCCIPEFPVAHCGFEFSDHPYLEPE